MLTNEQLAERAALYADMQSGGGLAEMNYAAICAEQEPALLARLREAERLLREWRDKDTYYELIVSTNAYFARVNAAQPQKEQA